jgi:hypothetical protein
MPESSGVRLTACNVQILSARLLGGIRRGVPIMRTHVSALTIIMLVGFGGQVNAEARCPELTRLRSEAAEAAKQTMGLPTWKRCETYIRASLAWNAVAQYANDHREQCDVSVHLLDDFEKYYREAIKICDNVCAGRPARPFPPDIIQR